MTKSSSPLSVREKKAEALDAFVKAEPVRKRELISAKTAKLKAACLARDEQEANAAASRQPAEGMAVTRKTIHLRRFS